MLNKTDKDTKLANKDGRTAKVSFVFWLPVALALIGLDQLTKYLAFHSDFGSFLNALAPVVKKARYFNSNFAFSLPLPQALMYVIYIIILLAIARYLYRNAKSLSTWSIAAWVFILAGAISNIVERIALGYVRDFVYILSGIFNLADGFIIFGIIILILVNFQHSKGSGNTKLI